MNSHCVAGGSPLRRITWPGNRPTIVLEVKDVPHQVGQFGLPIRVKGPTNAAHPSHVLIGQLSSKDIADRVEAPKKLGEGCSESLPLCVTATRQLSRPLDHAWSTKFQSPPLISD